VGPTRRLCDLTHWHSAKARASKQHNSVELQPLGWERHTRPSERAVCAHARRPLQSAQTCFAGGNVKVLGMSVQQHCCSNHSSQALASSEGSEGSAERWLHAQRL
jgi:hypothetical protein